jgi:hypothetical protein
MNAVSHPRFMSGFLKRDHQLPFQHEEELGAFVRMFPRLDIILRKTQPDRRSFLRPALRTRDI